MMMAFTVIPTMICFTAAFCTNAIEDSAKWIDLETMMLFEMSGKIFNLMAVQMVKLPAFLTFHMIAARMMAFTI